VWHLFVVRTAPREALRAYLAERGIATQIHYPIPPHRSGAYRSLGYQVGAFPLAEQLAAEVLSLPISPHHTAEQIDSVGAAVRSFFDSR
jgi:dTDP-4-amino-4,6-dideoxygalactose transaminase